MIKLQTKVAPIKKRLRAVAPIKAKNKYEYWVEFDVLGEKVVRAKLEGGKYGSGRLDAAVEWLSTKEEIQKREKKRDADVKKAITAARIAMIAAWITAIAALAIGAASLYFYFS